jgi:hypothetical protein
VSLITGFVISKRKGHAAYNRKAILDRCLKGGSQGVFVQGQWTFQSNSAPCHRAKITKEWFRACIQDSSIITNGSIFLACEPAGLCHMGHIGGQGQRYQA